ncbi:MAG TPA: DUF2723 domain-containing protein [Bacteroidia bacterium]|mgnify:CR=1 FL=1|nr:DUF2723 domain-containing protein [Bacteroidia bacterium]
MNYQRTNNLVGWITFLIATFVYISTIEPTGSFWDCGEFIATAHKLEVGHPPGAPLFLMLARIFILFGGDNVRMFPIAVNILSALMSSFTILFLFWTITALAKKIVIGKAEASADKIIAVMGAGLVGALAYTFTDSFWFSAVEGEVYASSSFFTAIVFWAIFKWENHSEEPHNLRWLILIAYLMGLSIGVHLLNLLTIPALAFVVYFKKYKVSTKGIIYTSLIGVLVLGFIQYGIIQGVITLAGTFDRMFVNGFGMPFGSGIIFYGLLIIGGVIWGLIYTKKKNHPIWNTAILCFTFIMIGYSSFAQIIIRSAANPPLDENNPENVFNFISYLKREQYGERPLFIGQYYNARIIDQVTGDDTWAKIEGEKKYVKGPSKVEPVYEADKTTVFPRMWSNQQSHINEYKKWADVKGDRTPTFGENLKFFFVYQMGEMYWRYFMWNFVGRQNDLQGPGGITKGNWISGIKFIDEMRLGPQDNLPESMTNNKARNMMFFLPFILGIIGMVYHYSRDNKDAWVVMLLFFFTGVAIVIYLNGTPLQPRERDYAYAGSYYAFAIWIGLGVLSLYEFLKKRIPATAAALSMTALCLVAVPAVMAKAEWNDHDRSDRYTSRDFATDYLNSCERNAILFTNGDNDTFPLWYVQEVEGVRTDVRVVNLSLLNTDWYVDQLKRKYYDSDPINISWAQDKYMLGRRDYIPFYDRGLKEAVELKEMVDFMGSDDAQAKARTNSGEEVNYFPTKNVKLTVNREEVLANGVVSKDEADKIVPVMTWSLDGNYLMKNDLMILNILANNHWKRPIYFATTVGSENYLNLEPYFQLEGLTYRIVPIRTDSKSDMVPGRVNTNIMYNNVMTKFAWGNMNKPEVYLDENNMRMTTNFRINFSRLAEELMNENKRDSAIKVLDKCLEVMPDKTIPYNYFMTKIAELYYRAAGAYNRQDTLMANDMELTKKNELIAKANSISERITQIYGDNIKYYLSLKGTKYFKLIDQDMNQALYIMQSMTSILKQTNQKEIADKTEKKFLEYAKESGY